MSYSIDRWLPAGILGRGQRSAYKLGMERCHSGMNFSTAGCVLSIIIVSAVGGCATKGVDVERERMLSLSFDQFDQTEGSGFRFLLDQKRYVEAAELIEAYVRRHWRGLTERERVSLHFHAGQLYGIAGNPGKAGPHLKSAHYRNEPTPDGHPPYWNAYVDATRAFIEGDRPGLIEARKRMGDLNEGFHRLVDSFIAYFGEPYASLIYGQKMKRLPEEGK